MSVPRPVNCRFDKTQKVFAFQVIWDSIKLDCAITIDALKKQFPVHRSMKDRLQALEASAYIGKKAWNLYKDSGSTDVVLDAHMI